MAENQVVFRRFNEKLQKDIDTVNKVAEESGDEPIVLDGDEPLFFYCECSDEQCALRIEVTPNEYTRIHAKRDCFTIMNGHEIPAIEEVIEATPRYCVVRKFETPRESVRELATTDINNV
jgi:hypothetical protein